MEKRGGVLECLCVLSVGVGVFCLHSFYSSCRRGICGLFGSFRMMDLIPLSLCTIHHHTYPHRDLLVATHFGHYPSRRHVKSFRDF